jgi:hypothetical protein
MLAAFRQYFFEGAKHQRKRRPEFVAYVAEEPQLGVVQFRQRLSTLSLSLVRDGIGEGASNLVGKQRDEPAILIVEPAIRFKPAANTSDSCVCPC